MIKSSRQRKASGSLFEEFLPLYFRGDQSIFNYVQLRLQTTITFSKAHMISLPLKIFNNQKQDFVEPLAQIETFDELSKEAMLKNKSLIKEGIFYVYFPANVRVDQKIFKIYQKNFENLIKDLPKALRQNFARIIIYEQGTGEHNINMQKQKLQQLLSNTIKMTIQKKIQAFTSEIATLQGLQLNPKILKSLFVARNKISSIFKQLKLPLLASEHLTSLFNDLLYNSKKFLQVSGRQSSTQKVIFKSPFIVRNINAIFGYFDSRHFFLQILNFCFIKVYEIQLDTLKSLQGMERLKQYADFVIGNIWGPVNSKQQDIAKNIWLVQTINECLRILKSRDIKPILNIQKQQQFQLLNVSICGMYRNAIQRIGVILYGLNTYCVFPRNLEYELQLCIKNLKGREVTEKEYPQLKIVSRQKDIDKMAVLSGEPVNQIVEMLLNGFASYKIVYIRTLQLMEKTLSNSPYKKVSWSMKLSVLKSTIIYFQPSAPSPLSLRSLLQQPASQSYDTRKSVWQDLEIINKVYRITLCKRYHLKMSVQELLNIILDKAIIHIVEKWKLLVEIVAEMLFQDNQEKQKHDNKNQDELKERNRINKDSIKIYEMYKNELAKNKEKSNNLVDETDFGQEQEDSEDKLMGRKRRRTTIHYRQKQIQVGTLKFISVIQSTDSVIESAQFQAYNNPCTRNKVKLNIEVSNRMVSYAFPLIHRSKTLQSKLSEEAQPSAQQSQQNAYQSQHNPAPPITLNFQILTTTGQLKLIPFTITSCQDKIMQVQITSNEVIIFRIHKLLLDIDSQIRLVYTMPINHEKTQLHQTEQTCYKNVSPELKINTVHMYTNQLRPKEAIMRKQSGSSTTSRPCSMSSSPSASCLVYKRLWTPVKFMFACAQGDWMEIYKITIDTLEDVSGIVFVGDNKVAYKEITSLKINSTQQKHTFPVIIFLKPKQTNHAQKIVGNPILPASFVNATVINALNTSHKQSFSLQSKHLRSRTHSVSQSISGSSFIDGNRVLLTLHICHHSYKYTVSQELLYGKVSPFKVQYRYAHEFQQYTLGNTTDQIMQVEIGQKDKQSEEIIQLNPGEQMKVYHNQVKVCLNYQQDANQNNQPKSKQNDSSTEQQVNIMRLLKLDQLIDLKSMIKKQHLKPQKISTIFLSLSPSLQQNYPIFQPIYIHSQQTGYLSILKHNQNDSQLIGKIQGVVGYMIQESSQKQKNLQLMLVPTKRGTITLPEISINCRKGVWKNGKTIKVI